MCFIQFLNNSVAVKFEDGKIKEYTKEEIEMVDADVNVEIEDNRINNYIIYNINNWCSSKIKFSHHSYFPFLKVSAQAIIPRFPDFTEF